MDGEMAGRLLRVGGKTREGQGIALGKALGESARKIYDLKHDMYKERGEGMLELWEHVAKQSKAYIMKYAPMTWDIMQGFASAGTIDIETLLKLSTEYEMLMSNGHFDLTGVGSGDAGKCSGMATTNNAELGILCAQSNDENPSYWFDAKYDVIIHSKGGETGDLSTLVYTHPGYPAYMGLNSAGLAILWQYIDNGERAVDKGLPTCVLLREILNKRSAREALEWLRSVPRTVPNNFIICDTEDVFNVECSPKRFTVLEVQDGDVCHANHCLFDNQMMDNDIGLKHSLSSPGRQEALRKRIREATPGIDIEAIKKIYSTAPLLRVDGSTLATMIFEVKSRRAHMRFKGDARSPMKYLIYEIPQDEWITNQHENGDRPAQKKSKVDG